MYILNFKSLCKIITGQILKKKKKYKEKNLKKFLFRYTANLLTKSHLSPKREKNESMLIVRREIGLGLKSEQVT